MESFKKDLKRKELIPIKILMFLIYGGQATLYPYFTVHLKSLGVSIKHTAIIFAVQPIIALLVAPMVGMLADKIGNFKLIFSFFLTFSAITANMLLFVPAVPAQEKLLYLSLSCKSNAEAEFRFLTDKSCSIMQEERNSYLNMTLEFHCEQNYLSNTEKGQPSFYLQNEEKCQNHCSNSSIDGCTIVEEDSAFYFFLNASYLFNTEDQESQITQRSENISQRLLNSDAYFISYENKTYDALTCSCFSSQRNGTLCTFVSKEPVENCLTEEYEEFGITFWTYLSIRLIVTLGIGLVNGLFDAASMAIIQKLKADVGFQRFWSTVAMCLMAPISGYFVDEYDTFKPCFFMYGALYLIAAFTSLKLDLSMKLPSENPLRNLALLIRNPEVILLLMQIAVLGICWGFLENFLFWFLESELEANNLIMGLTVTVGSGTGLFMALVATWFTKKLGYVNVIIVAFIAYTVRFFGYALAMDAYTCLIFEMMENFTVTLLTVGVTLYCTELASLEMLTTIMTLWNGLHIISGRAFGSLLGGFLVQNFGFRHTFQYFAYGSAACGTFYALMYVLWLRKWRKTHRKVSADDRRKSSLPDEMEIETLKTQAFSSISMHCSFDSPAIVSYLLDSKEMEIRRRAMSHIPISPMSSFGKSDIIPRQAMSFSEGNPPRSLPSLLEVPQFNQNNSQLHVSYKHDEDGYGEITKF